MRSGSAVSERRAFAIIGQLREMQRRRPIIRDHEDALTAAIIRLATTYGRYGYSWICAMIRIKHWYLSAGH